MTIGENIRKRRMEYDIEQQELAKKVGIGRSAMCQIEKGLTLPKLEVLFLIADALHCTVDELRPKKAS